MTKARRGLSRRIRFRPAGSRITLSNLVQGLVTILVALVVAAGAFLTGSAAGKWQESVSAQTKRSLATIEDVRFVYTDEAPRALELALAEAREAESSGSDAETEREVLFAARQATSRDNLAANRYRQPGRGYDVPRRLADVREQNANLTRISPEAALEAGDRRNRLALVLLWATLPLVLLYVAADIVLRGRATRFGAAPTARAGDVGLVPRPWSSPTTRRLWVSVALGAWLMITLLPPLQTYYAGKEQRAGALAAGKTAEISSMLEASGLVFAFATNSKQRAQWLASHALGRRLVAFDSGDPQEAAGLRATARAEQAVSRRALAIATSMGRAPSADDGLDAYTLRSVNATPDDWSAALKEQNAHSEHVSDLSARSKRISLAILFGALAGSLCALAAAARQKRHTWLDLASLGVLGLSLAAVASVPFV
jgi:hypothetical protein